MLKSNILLSLTLAGIAAWHLLTIRAGHDWGDDFGLYLQHAKNIAEGRPYADTGYIYNPSLPTLSPRTYPPVFPLLLAPIYCCCGLNLSAMKALVIVLLAGFLFVTHCMAQRELPSAAGLTLLLMLGLNPYVWEQKDRLLSEIPFLLSVALSLWLFECIDAATGRRRMILGILSGVCLYLAFGTRTVGVVLPLALIGSDLLRFQRVTLSTAAALAVFGAGVLLQKALFAADGSYFDQFVFDPRLFAANFISLVKAMGLFVDNGFNGAARSVLFLLWAILALVGYVRCLCLRGLTTRELFGPLYFAVIVVWPCADWGQRFLLPLLPLFFLYGLHGLVLLRENARFLLVPAAALPALILASYLGRYAQLDFGPHREGVTKPESIAFFEYVKANTGREDVFVFQKPRALALFTERRAAAHHTPQSDDEFWTFLHKVGATHLVVCRLFRESEAVLRPFVERNGEQMREEFHNGDFIVYRLESRTASGHAMVKDHQD